MIVALDVDYRPNLAMTACVAFLHWSDSAAAFEQVSPRAVQAATYEPGSFYRRELPCLLDAIRRLAFPISVAIVDGYVWLGPERPGLGAHLHAAVDSAFAVVGVAKGPFRGASTAIEVLRGQSRHPLYVTAVGMDGHAAAEAVRGMHGPHRLPTLLKRVDRLARDGS